MADEISKRDENRITGVMAVTDDANVDIRRLLVDPSTGRLKVTGTLASESAVDTAAGSTDSGINILAVRDDSLTTLTPADGDYVSLRVNSTGALHVTGGGGGTQVTLGTDTYTEGSSIGTVAGAVRNDILATLADTDNEFAPLQVNANGALYSILVANSGVDIGDVDVTSIVPGVGATNLGKAEDAVHASGDTGVMMLGVRMDDALSIADADGDYSTFLTSEHGCLNVDPQHFYNIDSANAITGWTVLNADVTNLATATNHVFGTASLEFDKINGGADSIVAGIQKTITLVDLHKHIEEGGGFILWSLDISSVADLQYAFIRLGTNSTNYNEWRAVDDDLVAGWNNLRAAISSPSSAGSTGNGWDSSAVTYVAIGVVLDAQNDALADIRVDRIFINSGLQTSADIVSQVSTSVSSPNVRVTGWTGSVDTGAGNVSANGSLRVVIGSDQNFVSIEDVAHSTGDAGIMALAVENEDQADLSTGDKDYTPIAVTKEGNVIVKQEGTIAVTESSPISGFATSAKQLADGHNVTIDNINSNEVFVRGSQSAGSPVDGEVITIQGIASGTNIQVIGTIAATSDSVPNLDGTNLLGTHALLSARADVNTTIGLTAENSTHNALHVAISDGAGIANVNASNQLDVAVGNTVTVDLAGNNDIRIESGQVKSGAIASGAVASGAVASGAFASGSIATGAVAAGGASFVKLEDVASAAADAGVPAMARRTASPADTSGDDLDYEMLQMDNGRLWVSATVDAALPTGSNAIGKLAANSGVDIGDVDVTSLPDTLQGPAAISIDSYTQVAINLTTGNDQVLVSSAANKQIWVYGYGFTCGDADGQTVSFQDEDNAALSGIMEFSQYGGMAVAPSGNFAMPIWKLATNKDLEVDIGGGDVDGWIAYAILSV